MDVSSFLDKGRDIQTGILDFGQVFYQLEVSQVVIICAKTSRRCDVTGSVDS